MRSIHARSSCTPPAVPRSEASYMYQLFGRMYGTNNFPDSSNMCHETTSVALPEVIGVPVGTVLLTDFDETDCIFFFGHNTTTNAPRMLHPLEEAAQRRTDRDIQSARGARTGALRQSASPSR